MRRNVILVLALVISGCAKDLDQLGAFDCAEDGRCPGGYSCVDDRCVKVALDQVCTTNALTYDSDPCNVAVTGMRCVVFDSVLQQGVCTLACGSGSAPCPTDHACVEGVCVVTTIDPASCPEGLAPQMRMDTAGTAVSACVPEVGPSLDQPCTSNEACALQTSGAACVDGTCVMPCTDSCADTTRMCFGGMSPTHATQKGCSVACQNDAVCADVGPPNSRCLVNHCVVRDTRSIGLSCDNTNECAETAVGKCLIAGDDDVSTKTYRGCSITCRTVADCNVISKNDFDCSEGYCVLAKDPVATGCAVAPLATWSTAMFVVVLGLRRRRTRRGVGARDVTH